MLPLASLAERTLDPSRRRTPNRLDIRHYHFERFLPTRSSQLLDAAQIKHSEGEYYHYHGDGSLDSYKDWRKGLPLLWYPTHSTAYYVCVTDKSFNSVSCVGFESGSSHFLPGINAYNNLKTDEVTLFETSEGGMSLMLRVGQEISARYDCSSVDPKGRRTIAGASVHVVTLPCE